MVLFANRLSDLKKNFQIQYVLKNLHRKYRLRHLHFIETTHLYRIGTGRQLAASSFADDSLLLFLDINVVFNREFVMRVRLNTIPAKQVYFPIVLKCDNKTNIFWNLNGFGNMAAYKKDLDNINGYDESSANEKLSNDDLHIYEKFIQSKIFVFRSTDPGIANQN